MEKLLSLVCFFGYLFVDLTLNLLEPISKRREDFKTVQPRLADKPTV
jgi:hypothetical protein